jgi:hypothetical protein
MPLGVDAGCKEPFVSTLLLPAHVLRRTIELERGSSASAEYFRRELYLDSLRSQVKLAVRIATQE